MAQLVELPLVDDPSGGDDRRPLAEDLHLGEQVAGVQHGHPFAGEAAQKAAEETDTSGVETVGRLVDQQQPRAADQAGGDAEPLTHALRVLGDAIATAVAQLDRLQHLVDLLLADPLAVVAGEQASLVRPLRKV